MKNRYKKIFFTFAKIFVIILSYLYIINRLKDVDFAQLVFFSKNRTVFLFSALFLSVINWSIEAKKWQFLVSNVQKISFPEAFKNTLVGIVLGMFTPNRLGEIGGKAFYLNKNNKIKGAIAASLGSLAQLTVTVVVGILGFAILLFFLKSFNFYNLKCFSICFMIFGILLLLLFFNINKLLIFISKLNFAKKIMPKLEFLSQYDKFKLYKILILSFLRYLVFVFQFYLLLRFFDVQIDFFIAIAGIFTVFLLMNVLPNVLIADLGIRGSVSMFVLGQFASNIQGILLASVFLWIINILLPAFLGQFFLLKTKSNVVF
ncbi:MAG: flippase-like domain-containing protein [Bacteroidales bacterium]|nr:flippase-like domain-containing protein [Bacteroidales bacterium]